MDSNHTRATALLALYDSDARAVLEDLEIATFQEIDAAATVLRRALSAQRMLRVGFLGESQVGKSSIINALIGQRALPSGGIGPLTAQATTIAHSDAPAVRVRYHGRQRLNQFRFALQRYLATLGDESVVAAPTEEAEDDSDGFALLDFSKAPEGADAQADGTKAVGEYLVNQTRLLLDLRPEVKRGRLLDLLGAVLAKDAPDLSAESTALQERILLVRRLLDGEEVLTRAELDHKAFNEALRIRAAGWMSPLVSELHVTLDLPLLRHADIVDLPGVGVVADPAGRVAGEFVSKDADALVIVMRNNGLTQQIAGLLEHTGVISRLLWGLHGPQGPIHVAIAVTRLDDVARDEWRKRTLEARESGVAAPRREDIFSELATQMADMVRRQLGEALMTSREFDDLPPDLRDHRERVVRDLVRDMTVVCVSAPDYLGLQEGFEDDCFLRHPDATNVPQLGKQLLQLAQQANEVRGKMLVDAVEVFGSLLERMFEQQERARRDRKGARTEAELRFRERLEAVAKPMKADALEHRRAFTAFLAKTMPQQLEDLSKRAAERARRRLRNQTEEGQVLHWATLNAALVRNGAFQGVAKIDYPGALTRAFVDVVGGSWEQMVVDSVRAALKTLSNADAELVEGLCVAATEILETEELNVTIKEIRAQLREQGKTSVTWTQAQLEELSDDVRTRLFEVVAKPIEQACRAAQRAGRNQGQGARARILEVFDEGGTAAIEAARRACVAILEDHLKGLARSLGGVLRENYDPVTHVFDTIVDAQSEMIAQMSDQRRKEQLSAIRVVIKRMKAVAEHPAPATAEEEAPPMSRPGIVVAPGANVRDAGSDIFEGV